MEHILFLRGINTGGKTIKMEGLRSALSAKGYTSVQTLLNTGNVILNSSQSRAALTTEVELLLFEKWGFTVKVVHRTAGELRNELRWYPHQNVGGDHHRYMVFLKDNIGESMVAEAITDPHLEKVAAGERVMYWEVEKGHTLDSPFAKYLAKMANNILMTTRNVNTVEKLLSKCGCIF